MGRVALSEARRAWMLETVRAAKARLKVGDKITFTSCPGTKRWAIVTGWDGNWICSATRNDIAASSVSKVNGEAVDFTPGPRPVA